MFPYPSVLTYVLGAQKNRLNESVSLKNISVLMRLFDFISNISRKGSLSLLYSIVNFKSECSSFKTE